MSTFNELADQLEPLTRASFPPRRVRVILPAFERAALELWNERVGNTPGFDLRFEDWHAVATYLAQKFPDAVRPPEFWGPEDNLLAAAYVDCFRLLADQTNESGAGVPDSPEDQRLRRLIVHEDADKLLRLLASNPKLTNSKLARQIQRSTSTVKRQLQTLVDLGLLNKDRRTITAAGQRWLALRVGASDLSS